MFPFGFNPMKAEEKKVDKPKGDGIPFACIKKRDNRSYCGREVTEAREYMFGDAVYAMKHYRNSTFMKVCPDCAKECERAGVGEIKFMAPMATRGEENNR